MIQAVAQETAPLVATPVATINMTGAGSGGKEAEAHGAVRGYVKGQVQHLMQQQPQAGGISNKTPPVRGPATQQAASSGRSQLPDIAGTAPTSISMLSEGGKSPVLGVWPQQEPNIPADGQQQQLGIDMREDDSPTPSVSASAHVFLVACLVAY